MRRPACDPVAFETPSPQLRVASACRSFNTRGSFEFSSSGAPSASQGEDMTVLTTTAERGATRVPLAGVVRFRETLGARRSRTLACERGHLLERTASALKHIRGTGR